MRIIKSLKCFNEGEFIKTCKSKSYILTVRNYPHEQCRILSIEKYAALRIFVASVAAISDSTLEKTFIEN